MTGCGCVLLVALLAALFYLFTFGASDTGEQVEQAVALIVGTLLFAAVGFAAAFRRRRYAVRAIAGRRVPQLIARS